MTLYTGLVSITFRQLDPNQIIELVHEAGLDGIEWGGDVHVPHGDLDCARKVGEATRNAGLKVISYGSYYDLNNTDITFSDVMDTARALETDHIRIWAGSQGSADVDSKHRAVMVKKLRAVCREADWHGIGISCEYHAGTLTDTPDSAVRLVREVGCKNFGLYWQPVTGIGIEANTIALQKVIPYLTNIHVFYWHPAISDRLPLVDGISDWMHYFDAITRSSRDHAAMLEFVKDDKPESFLEDARTLKLLLH